VNDYTPFRATHEGERCTGAADVLLGRVVVPGQGERGFGAGLEE
jgi:hypothetical protein